MWTTASILLASLGVASGGFSPRDARVRYVEPRELVSVPAVVRASLTARGCRIPIADEKSPGRPSAVRGTFYGKESRQDWAILCSRSTTGVERRSTLFVFGKSRGWQIDSVGPTMADRPFPIFTAEDSARASHALDWDVSVASVTLIPAAMRACPQNRSECPTRSERRVASHEGILQGERSDGATSIFYWTGRRWVELPGGD